MFFLFQCLASTDWTHYKPVERTLPYFELMFFIPFSVIDAKCKTQFAVSVVELTRQKVVGQRCACLNEQEAEFFSELDESKQQGYIGSSLICTESH